MQEKLTKRVIQYQLLPKDSGVYNVTDSEQHGLTLRIAANGTKTFFYVYREKLGKKRIRYVKLGAFPAMSVELARKLCAERAAQRELGEDPAELAQEKKRERYIEDVVPEFILEHVENKKAETQKQYRKILELTLSNWALRKVKNISQSDILKLKRSMLSTPYMLNRTLAVLSKFFNYCCSKGYSDINPVKGVERAREEKKLEFMDTGDIGRVMEALDELYAKRSAELEQAKSHGKFGRNADLYVVAALKLLLLTGARKMEILALRWEQIHIIRGADGILREAYAILDDSKTGQKVIQLPAPAVVVLESLERTSVWCFPSDRADRHIVELRSTWYPIRKALGLENFRIHDLRHAFISQMVSNGVPLAVAGAVAGHKNQSTTMRYAHCGKNVMAEAAALAAEKISNAAKEK